MSIIVKGRLQILKKIYLDSMMIMIVLMRNVQSYFSALYSHTNQPITVSKTNARMMTNVTSIILFSDK